MARVAVVGLAGWGWWGKVGVGGWWLGGRSCLWRLVSGGGGWVLWEGQGLLCRRLGLWWLVVASFGLVVVGGAGKARSATVNYSSGYLAGLAAGLGWLSRFMIRCRLGISYKDPAEKVDRVLAEVVQSPKGMGEPGEVAPGCAWRFSFAKVSVYFRGPAKEHVAED